MLQRATKQQQSSPCHSVDSTADGSSGHSDDVSSCPEVVQRPTLRTHGEAKTLGSISHPTACTPCVFYCFKRQGCADAEQCAYCHLAHVSRQSSRREDWKQRQRERRPLRRVATEKTLQPTWPQKWQSEPMVPVSNNISLAIPEVEDPGPLRAATLAPKPFERGCSSVRVKGMSLWAGSSEPPQSPASYLDEPWFISLNSGGELYQMSGQGPVRAGN